MVKTPKLGIASISPGNALIGILLVIPTGYIAISSLWAAFAFGKGPMYMDEWDSFLSLQQLIKEESGLWRWFISKHMEHMLVLPRAQFLAEWYIFKSQNLFLIGSIVVSQLLSLAVLVAILRGHKSYSGLIICTIVSALLSAAQLENFTWGFQVQFVQVYLFAILSFFTLTHPKTPESYRIPAGLFFALCSFFSMTNGIIVFPLIIILAIYLRRWILLSVSTVILPALVFIVLYKPKGSMGGVSISLRDSLISIPEMVQFALVYISNPVGEWNFLTAQIMGALLLLFYLSLLAFSLIHKELRSNWKIQFLIAVSLFILGTAFITALGRYPMGLAQAGSDRYTTPAIFFAASTFALGVVSVSLSNPSKLREFFEKSLLIFCMSYFLIIVGSQAYFLGKYSDWSKQKTVGLNAIQLGVHDLHFKSFLHPNPSKHSETIDIIQRHANGESLYDWKDHVFDLQYLPSAKPSLLELTFTEIPSENDRLRSFIINGMIDPDAQLDFREKGTLLAQNNPNFKGVVYSAEGLGNIPFSKNDESNAQKMIYGHANISSKEPLPESGFLLVSKAENRSQANSFAVKYQKRDSVEMVDFATVPPYSINFEVEIQDEAWTVNGYYPEPKPPDELQHCFGSWSGNDAFTGQIQIALQSDDEIEGFFLPFITGPVVPNGQIIIQDADGNSISHIEVPRNTGIWRYLKIELPVPRSEITLIIEEDGEAWGQWVGFAEPRSFQAETYPVQK